MITWNQLYNVVFLLVWFVSICECVRRCEVIDRCSCRYSDSGQVISLWGIDNPNDVA